MATNRKTPGIVNLGVIVFAPALFYVLIGAEWYEKGHLRFCARDNSFLEPTGRLPRPKSADDLKQSTYWCYKPPPVRADDPNCWETPRVSRPEEVKGPGQWNLLCGRPNGETYARFKPWLGYDAFVWLPDWILAVLRTAVDVTVGQWFWNAFIPAWNEFFAGADSQAAAVHRGAFAVIVASIWVATLSVMIKMIYDWASDRQKPARR